MDKWWWQWMPGKRRAKWKLEKFRIEALSSITGDHLRIERMAQRPRAESDVIDTSLLETVQKHFAEFEERAKDSALIDDLKDLIQDGEVEGLFTAYFCPINDIEDEGKLVIDNLEGWGIPKASTKRLRDLFAKKLEKAASNPQDARGALHAIYAEEDAWSDYKDDYEETMRRYIVQLFWATIILLILAIVALRFAFHFSGLLPLGLLFAGAAGSCVSVMAKVPALDGSLAGELDAYGRRILSRTVVGAIGSLIGCALLGWGFIPIAIQNQTFTDALNACTTSPLAPGMPIKTLIVLGVAMLLGVSERTLTSFEQQVFGSLKSHKR